MWPHLNFNFSRPRTFSLLWTGWRASHLSTGNHHWSASTPTGSLPLPDQPDSNWRKLIGPLCWNKIHWMTFICVNRSQASDRDCVYRDCWLLLQRRLLKIHIKSVEKKRKRKSSRQIEPPRSIWRDMRVSVCEKTSTDSNFPLHLTIT